MLHRFATLEEAALFVSMKRSEGYFAEILHEQVAVLWCPLAMGGVAAWVSEEAAEEEDEVPELRPEGPTLPMVLSLLGMVLMVGVPATALSLFVLALLRHAMHYPQEAGAIVVALLVFGGALLLILMLCALCACFLSRWVHALWDPLHPGHLSAKGVHMLMAMFLLLVCTPVGMVLLGGIVGFN